MSGIYINDGNDPRISVEQVQSLITGVSRQIPIGINVTRLGFLVKFAHDLDCNIMFNPHVVHLFKQKRLSLFLSKFSQKNREVYILDPSDDILSTQDHLIMNDINNRYATSILHCKKIASPITQRKYILLTLEKRDDMTRLTSMGKITVFNQQFTAEQKREDNPNLNAHNVRQQPQIRGQQNQTSGIPGTSALGRLSNWGGPQRAFNLPNGYSQPPPSTQTGPAYRQPFGSQYNHSSQQAISNHNGPIQSNIHSSQQRPGLQLLAAATQGSFPTPLSTQPTVSSINGTKYAYPPLPQYGPGSQTPSQIQSSGPVNLNLQPPQVGTVPQTQAAAYQGATPSKFGLNSDQLVKLISSNLTNVCEILSTGLENPDLFVIQYNQILTHNGIPSIDIPKIVIDSSKSMYNFKKSNNYAKVPFSSSYTPSNTSNSTTTSINSSTSNTTSTTSSLGYPKPTTTTITGSNTPTFTPSTKPTPSSMLGTSTGNLVISKATINNTLFNNTVMPSSGGSNLTSGTNKSIKTTISPALCLSNTTASSLCTQCASLEYPNPFLKQSPIKTDNKCLHYSTTAVNTLYTPPSTINSVAIITSSYSTLNIPTSSITSTADLNNITPLSSRRKFVNLTSDSNINCSNPKNPLVSNSNSTLVVNMHSTPVTSNIQYTPPVSSNSPMNGILRNIRLGFYPTPNQCILEPISTYNESLNYTHSPTFTELVKPVF